MDERDKDNDEVLTQSQWDLDQIVAELRTLRTEWQQNTEPDGVTYELPSQEALSDFVDGVSAALFPRHFGPPALREEGVDYFVGRTLDRALQSLLEQVRRELRLGSGPHSESSAPDEQLDAVMGRPSRA